MSSRITPVDPASANGPVRDMLGAVRARLGIIPNLARALAHSPAALEGYLALNGALAKGSLPAAVREQIALNVAQQNGCEYCLAAHVVLGGHAGLSPQDVTAARCGNAADAKSRAVLKLANQIVVNRGNVTDAQVSAARGAGVTDGELAEIVAHVALNVLTNYFNLVAQTDVDFPKVSLSL